MSSPRRRPPALLRWLASFLIRGREAQFVLGDLDERFARDVERGGSRAKAGLRYLLDTCRSSLSVAGERFRSRTPAVSWLDVKLGLRMLTRQPVVTLVAVLTLALGIPVGMYPFHVVSIFQADLPVEGGDRVRMIRYFDPVADDAVFGTGRHFARWRDGLTTFEAVAASTAQERYNVISEDGRAAPVFGAQVTGFFFEVLGARPLLGRTLRDDDEAVSAPEVVVISRDLWESRLAGDPDVVGRTIRVGGVPHTIVGVMPEHFRYPVRDQLWIPMRLGPAGERFGDRPLLVFGRLAEGVGVETAEAELSALGSGADEIVTDAEARLRPEAVPVLMGMTGERRDMFRSDPEFWMIHIVALMVLIVAGANVAMLIFARTVKRSTELAIRTALGASRPRVITQLFVEALVLAVLAAGVGLLVGDQLVLRLFSPLDDVLPYWVDMGVRPSTVGWALSLAAVSAAVVGIAPALKATGRTVQQNIQRAAAGRSGARFGGVSSALIVADVALSVMLVGTGLTFLFGMTDSGDGGVEAAAHYLSAEVTVPVGPSGAAAASRSVIDGGLGGGAVEEDEELRLASVQEEILRRLRVESGVGGVAAASVLPGMDHLRGGLLVEVDADPGSRGASRWAVASVDIDPGFFEAMETPVLAGRAFDAGDLREGSTAVIVNTDFVERVLGGRNPIGRRLRYVSRSDDEHGPWLQVVGVVERLGTINSNTDPAEYQAVYRPMRLGTINPLRIAVRTGPDPGAFTPRLRQIVSEVDPSTIVSDPRPLDEVVSFTRLGGRLILLAFGMLIGILVGLSASGIYALMSFTVTERTREIGIRTALGARRSRIVYAVGRRALAQLGIGVMLGSAFGAYFVVDSLRAVNPEISPAVNLGATLLSGAGVSISVGLLACTGPTLRALRIMPSEALRAE